jgi:hypothetical protein
MPNWVSVLQWGLPILTGVLGIPGFWFGWHKWRVDRQDQLNLRFYDKRKEIYDAIMEFVATAVQKGTVTQEDLDNLARRTKEARHLFDDKIKDLCDQLYKEGVAVMVETEEIMGIRTSKHPLQTLRDLGKWKVRFKELLDTLPAQFDRYLKVKK